MTKHKRIASDLVSGIRGEYHMLDAIPDYCSYQIGRECFVLRHGISDGSQFTTDELARRFDVSTATVSRHCRIAVRALRGDIAAHLCVFESSQKIKQTISDLKALDAFLWSEYGVVHRP